MKISKTWRKSCAFMLSLLGVSMQACASPNHKDLDFPGSNSITIEGFELQNTEVCVYGGPSNYIRTKVYGTVTDGKSKTPLEGIKVALYSGTSEMAVTYTKKNGDFYFDEVSLWAGVGVTYTMIVSDPKNGYTSVKKDLVFDINEVLREESVVLQPK